MLFFQGSQAFSPFRLEQLFFRLKTKLFPISIDRLTARYVYFVDISKSLSEKQLNQLQTLLPDSKYSELPTSSASLCCWVVPRLGTISPWSSKATEIAQLCELKAVKRIERGVYWEFGFPSNKVAKNNFRLLWNEIHDSMTEMVIENNHELARLFQQPTPATFTTIDILSKGTKALLQVRDTLGITLDKLDSEYIVNAFEQLGRNPTDVELMMFAQVNSEHCRHKIFNARWMIDGIAREKSLFDMIRNTYVVHPNQVVVAYKDNAAVMANSDAPYFFVDPHTKQYQKKNEKRFFVLKVETHNHPTAISPYPGAATGSGGEIRDEAATGCGAQPKAGLTGFSVSHLHIPEFPQPWETCIGKPASIASALDIILQAPIGAATFNNEFGRPTIVGYFRTLEMMVVSGYGDICRGYHKPIMLA